MKPTILSHDPADSGSLSGALRIVARKLGEQTDGQLPAVVISYDRDRNVATVKPLIKKIMMDGSSGSRNNLAEIPVLALGGGGFVINFPLEAGDKGWIEASDRDISLFIQSMEESKPNTFRIHSFSDGRFIPDIFRAYTISGEDSGRMVIQKLDGTVKISLGESDMKLTAPTLNFNDAMTVTASAVDITVPVTISNNLELAGITMETHTHPQDTDSGGDTEQDTGGPQ